MSELFKIRLTRYVLADFAQRNVFPTLREEFATRQYGIYSVFNVTLNTVHALKSDATERYDAKEVIRGAKVAHKAVIDQMNLIIRRPEIERENRRREAEERKKFKDTAIKNITCTLGIGRSVLWKDDGYRFDNETLADVESVMCELKKIVEKGRIVHPSDDDLDAQPEPTAACKSDSTLQSFLKSATRDLSLVKNERPEGV